ncbi:MAG: imelysin family protein [Actinomycetota bacterium]
MIAGLVLFAMLASACGGGGDDRGDALTDLAEQGIAPLFERVDADMSALAAAVGDLCADPSPALHAAAHEALADARASWTEGEPLWVGPVMERRSWLFIDWAIAVDEVEELLADTSITLDEDRLANRIGADQRGLQVVEYFLGSPADPVPALDRLADPRVCDYVTGVAAVAAAEASLLPGDWTGSFEDGPPFVELFAEEDSDALNDLVNDQLFLMEAMTDRELGQALGLMEREPDLEAIEEGPAGLGAADLRGHLAGIRTALVGGTEHGGLGPLLGDDLADRIGTQLDAADAAVAGIEGPLREAIERADPAVVATRDAIKAVQVTVATEVVSLLGIRIGFSDADGDSGG